MRAHLETLHAERLSRVGAGLSLACAVHCLATPLALALFPLGGLGFFAESWTELLLVTASVASAGLGLCWGAHVHGEWRLLAGFAAALGLFLSSWLGDAGALETFLSALASTILAASLVINHRLCQSCTTCTAGAEERP